MSKKGKHFEAMVVDEWRRMDGSRDIQRRVHYFPISEHGLRYVRWRFKLLCKRSGVYVPLLLSELGIPGIAQLKYTDVFALRGSEQSLKNPNCRRMLEYLDIAAETELPAL